VNKTLCVFVFLLLTACSEQEDIQLVDPDIRVDPAMLERYEAADLGDFLPDSYYFMGVDRQYNTPSGIKKYKDLLAYLSKTTGFQFQLLFPPEGVDTIEILGDDLVQFATIGAVSMARGADVYGVSPLAREAEFEKKTVFVVKNDSRITDLNNVSQKRIALSIKGSVEGDLVPRVMLKRQGLLISDIKGAYYTNSAADCLEAVFSAKADICAVEERLATIHIKVGTLRVLQRSQSYPTFGIAHNIYVDDEVVTRIQRALLDYHEITYIPSDDELFSLLQKRVIEFNMQNSEN